MSQLYISRDPNKTTVTAEEKVKELLAENAKQRRTLAFCDGVLSVIEISPQFFNAEGAKEARRRIKEHGI